MASKVKLMVILGALVVFGAIFVPSAFAECGPGFSSKSQLIEVVKENPSIAHGIRKELLAEPKSEYNADETVLNYLRETSQKVEKAPSGYKLKTNTYCPSGYGHYQPYGGLLENMPGKVMLWHVNKNGEAIPLLKGYCMNFVTGKAVQKKSPPKHKTRKPKKCGCKHHKPPKKKPAPKCSAKSPNGGGGNCNEQVTTTTVTPTSECKNGGSNGTNNCPQTTTTVTIVSNCSNVNYESTGSNNNQGGNCNNGGTETCVGQNNCTNEETCVNNSCNVTPPPKEECGCKTEEPSIMITSKTELNMIPAGKNSGPFHIGVNASKAGGTLTVDPGIGGVSLCNSTTPQDSVTISNIASGASEQCVIIYAPEDADKPAEMTVTLTANLGSAHDQKEAKFKLTYPTRPA